MIRYIFFFTILIATSSIAQKQIYSNSFDYQSFNFETIELSKQKTNFRDYKSYWFSIVSDLVNIGEIPSPSSENPAHQVRLFPDSTIITGTNPISYPFIHGMADVINPSLTPSGWVDEWTDVLVDSIEIPFVYYRNTHDSIIDTLFIDYLISQPDSILSYIDLNQDNIKDNGEFPHQVIFHTDSLSNKINSFQISRTDTLLLDFNNSSSRDNPQVNYQLIDVNDSVMSKERYGIYIRFQPGYKWSITDTIINFNDFFLLAREQVKGQYLSQIWPFNAGFSSYIMTKDVRYNISVLGFQLYIPALIQSPEWPIEHLIISYKLISIPLGANNIHSKNKLKLFPNPVDDFLNFKFSPSNFGNLDVEIYDITGKIVLRDKLSFYGSGSNNFQFNVSHLVSGIYSIKVDGVSRKFVVK